MKNSMKKNPIISVKYLIIPLLLLVNDAALAEISSLTSEELTDTYIKDTTVIVRPQETKEARQTIPVKLKVTPLEQATQVLPENQSGTMSSISHELSTYDDLNNQRALENNLTPQLPIATTKFLKAPLSEATLNQVRQAYGIGAGETVDLSTLRFLTNLTPTNPGDIPAGSSYQTTERSFTIKIPNMGNFNTQQIASPNGEIGVNVTPSHIEYTLNLPK
ncbi:MAG: hypothetical protein KBT75_03545 [Oleispira antarctica]|uniref:WxL domain-containing protein n=1 Tax=Oleispira antarctica RB-8 TaxID=698738 RepID=R4YU02_OLEAN|nr:hypothetical protein [Oleispira antarctica]CCK76249.1 hypothetical protein OLEAN_C20730 [Oleispira antarctica RB-8]